MNSKKRAIAFTAITFFMSWTLAGVIYFFGLAQSPLYTPLLVVYMLFPAIGSLITRAYTREGFKDMKIRLKLTKNSSKYLFLAILAPVVLSVLGAIVYFLFFPWNFDSSMPLVRAQYAASGIEASFDSIPKGVFVLSQIVNAVILGGTINAIPAFGEELGWRGYLFPRLLEATTPQKALIISGTIWGLWHAPLIAMGHNYGVEYPGYPVVGIVVMTLTCVCFGALLCFISFKSKSVILTAISHGVFNGVAAIGTIFTVGEYNPTLGPIPLSLIGGIPVIIAGVYIISKADKLFAAPAAEQTATVELKAEDERQL